MRRASIVIRIDGPKRTFRAGDALSGSYALEGSQTDSLRAIELSVLWQTDGKGDEDLAVHYFERVTMETQPEFDVRRPRPFSTVLPNSPLSYDGVIVKIRWRVRVRAFFVGGRELVEEVPFQLGEVPTAKPVIV